MKLDVWEKVAEDASPSPVGEHEFEYLPRSGDNVLILVDGSNYVGKVVGSIHVAGGIDDRWPTTRVVIRRTED